jgi:hypothetical protein
VSERGKELLRWGPFHRLWLAVGLLPHHPFRPRGFRAVGSVHLNSFVLDLLDDGTDSSLELFLIQVRQAGECR